MRFITFFIALGCWAQSIPFPGPGMAHSSASYVGPGDVTSGAYTWWGLRAYSAATRGTQAINVCNVSDVVCADMSTDATTGALVITTIGGSDCSMVTCTVKIAYDKSGNTNCTTACDISQATIALRPTLIVSCVSGLPCLHFTATQFLQSPTSGSSHTQPVTVSAVGERTGGFTSFSNVAGIGVSGELQLGFTNAANTALIYAGGVDTKAATDSVFHAMQGLFNAASSILYIDGSSSTVNPGTGDPLTKPFGLGDINGNGLIGNVTEAGWWFSNQSANFSTMNSNQRTYWGF